MDKAKFYAVCVGSRAHSKLQSGLEYGANILVGLPA